MSRAALTAAMLLLASLVPASATSWYVNMYEPADFTSIGEAVGAASDGDTILVALGEYTGESNRDIDPGAKNLVITSEAYSYNTILNCEGQGRAFSFTSPAIDTSTVITDFTIRFGNVGERRGDGGAILCVDASPKIEFRTFNSCVADHGGILHLIH